MNDTRIAQELVRIAKGLMARRKEVVYSQGSNWIWMHDDGEEEELPYRVRSKRDVRNFIQERYDERRMGGGFVIAWD
jgi:hypothetical protein